LGTKNVVILIILHLQIQYLNQ